MIHEDLTRKVSREAVSDRSFGFTVGVAFALIACLPLFHHRPVRLWALALGAAFCLIAAFVPRLLHGINVLWMRLSDLLGRVMTPLMTSLMFFLVITPSGLALRLLRKDILRQQRDLTAKTYWVPRKQVDIGPLAMQRQF